jgi:protein phosphatase
MDGQISLAWQGTGLTDTGLVPQSNQDTFAVDNHRGLWIVADGMGGHAAGDTASRLAVEAVNDHLTSAAVSFPDSHNRIDQAKGLLFLR